MSIRTDAVCAFLAVALGLLTSCAASRDAATHPTANGLIITHDGRTVADTAEVARDEMLYVLKKRTSEAAGAGWKTNVEIAELPQFEVVRAEEWGWKAITITLTLVPAASDARAAEGVERATAAARQAVEFRVRNHADIAITSSLLAASAAAPGSMHYTAVAGDTLAGISTAFYGSSQHWRLIADANLGMEVAPGVELIIPPKP